jgi:hypothetical protein
MGYVSTRRSASGNKRVDDRQIHHGHSRCGPKSAGEVNIATVSETVKIWHECLGRQDKRHVRKVLEGMEISMNTAERKASVMDAFWIKCIISLSLHGRIDHRCR